MTAAAILASYALFLAVAGPRLLKRWWPSDRVPRLTVAVVLTIAGSFLITAVTSALCLAVTLLDELSTLSPAIDRRADQLPFADQTTTGRVVGHLGLTIAAAASTVVVPVVLALISVKTFAGCPPDPDGPSTSHVTAPPHPLSHSDHHSTVMITV